MPRPCRRLPRDSGHTQPSLLELSTAIAERRLQSCSREEANAARAYRKVQRLDGSRLGCNPAQDIVPRHPRGCPLLKPSRDGVLWGVGPSLAMWGLRHQGRVLGVRPCGCWVWMNGMPARLTHVVLLVSDEKVPRRLPWCPPASCSFLGRSGPPSAPGCLGRRAVV